MANGHTVKRKERYQDWKINFSDPKLVKENLSVYAGAN